MSEPLTLLIGTYTEPIEFGTGQILESQGRGIYSYRFNPADGEATFKDVTQSVRNPSYLTLRKRRGRKVLYAVNETKNHQGGTSGAVSAFRLDTEGTLILLNQQPSFGADPCHLTTDPTGKFLLVANFTSGSVSVFPLEEDGSLGDASDVVQHTGRGPHPIRQTGPHAHAVTFDPSGKFVYVPDLGLDRVMIYSLGTRGTLEPTSKPFVQVKPGAGPRQIVMHPKYLYAYLINELDSSLTVYERNENTGDLTEVQTLRTLPEHFEADNIGAEVQLSPSSEFLYASNRGHDSIALFRVSTGGDRLTLIGHESTRGRTPRHFTISPQGDFILAANQDSGTVVVFKREEATGRLEAVGQPLEVPTPVCVLFA